jgi:hypothetical protein
MLFQPEKPLWEEPRELLHLDKIRVIWSRIDGIETVTGSPSHHQLLIAGRGHRLFRQSKAILSKIRRHLDIPPSVWRDRQDFLERFAQSFLCRHGHCTVYVQLLPRRRTFRTLHLDGQRATTQSVMKPDFQYHAVCLGDQPLDLELGVRVDPDGLLMGGERDDLCDIDELWWTKIDVERCFARERVIETWFCLAYLWDRAQLMQGNVPSLNRFFDPVHKILYSALLSFTAITPSGRGAITHCCSLDPRCGSILDIRQSERSLAFQLRSAPHNHHGLGTLLFGREA